MLKKQVLLTRKLQRGKSHPQIQTGVAHVLDLIAPDRARALHRLFLWQFWVFGRLWITMENRGKRATKNHIQHAFVVVFTRFVRHLSVFFDAFDLRRDRVVCCY